MTTRVDYMIVGQGLAGAALALECIRRGKQVRIFDSPTHNRTSAIAAGICNPITGKGLTKTFLADEIFPFLHTWYRESEALLHGKYFTPLPVYRPFLSLKEQQEWLMKATSGELKNFVGRVYTAPVDEEKLTNPFGGLEVRQSGVLAVSRWLAAVRNYLQEKGLFEEEWLKDEELDVGKEIQYGHVRATHIIFCDGLAACEGRWFDWLPIRPLKGETLSVRVDFPEDKIISRGVYLVPSGEPAVFTAGSTYQHEPFEMGTTVDAMEVLRDKLQKLVRLPFEIIHQDWGIRPTVTDRRPLLGSHPRAENVIIFNGMGTKGVSLTPYFARVLVDWIEKESVLPEEVNISRFKSLYSN